MTMWHSSAQCDFISNHNCEAEFQSISYILVIIFPSCWVSHCESSNDGWQGKNPSGSLILTSSASMGREHRPYTVCQQEGRESGFCFLFFFSLFSLSWALHGRQGQMISQRSSQLYHSMISSPEASTKSTVESITYSQGWSLTQAHIFNFQPRAFRHSL